MNEYHYVCVCENGSIKTGQENFKNDKDFYNFLEKTLKPLYYELAVLRENGEIFFDVAYIDISGNIVHGKKENRRNTH